MKSEWILGRDCDLIKISDESVSRRHAKLSQDSEGYILEDLGSKNGTFVNGTPIKRKRISLQDSVVLGSYEINLQKLRFPMSDVEFGKAFQNLKKVYDVYTATKKEIQSSGTKRNIMARILPMAVAIALGGILIAILTFVLGESEGFSKIKPYLNSILLGAAMLIGGGFSSKQSGQSFENIYELDQQFKLDYICPDCKRHFGQTPWQNLKQQTKCQFCKRSFEVE
ncbi:MAG: FHA domain-containing protein [Holophagaceae bacterium]|nr:FHA domain-containing protein [Holophagaceae bacterium]